MQELCRAAAERGCTEIRGTYIPTAKNGLVRDLFARLGFEQVAERRRHDGVGLRPRRETRRRRTRSSTSRARRRPSVPVHDELERVFRDVFGDESIVLTHETTARDIAGWDSLGHINLMFSIEERFGVQFEGNQLAEFANVGELERFLEANDNSALAWRSGSITSATRSRASRSTWTSSSCRSSTPR